MENDFTGFCSTVIKEKKYVCCRKSCRIKKNLLLIYSFCIKNLYSYLYILQNGVVNTSLLKHFQNETLPWSLWEGRAQAILTPARDAAPDVCTAGQGVHEGPAPWLAAGNTGIPQNAQRSLGMQHPADPGCLHAMATQALGSGGPGV